MNLIIKLFLAELLTKNEDLDIWGEFNLVNLTANKILTKTINDVELNDVYLKSNQKPITGFKVFENLHTTKAKINILNGVKLKNFRKLF